MTDQLRAVDIHEWYRTEGIDWDRTAANFDIVGIRAVVGDHVDELLEEHVDHCQARKIKYFTYCIPGVNESPEWQADFYLDQYGVSDGLICGDVEPDVKGGALGTEYLYRKFFERLAQRRSDPAWYYSNYNNTKKIGNPAWIKSLPVFWGEYRYEYLTVKYRKFENFLARYPWWPPRWATELGISVTLHQFTDYGDARFYLANATTGNPSYPSGIKSADLSVGLVERSKILAMWDALTPPDPDPDPDLEDTVKDHERRITRLETFHEPDTAPPEPPKPPEPVGVRATINVDQPAMGISDYNDNGVPTIDVNLFKKYGHPDLKFFDGDIVHVLPDAVRGQGNTRWFRLTEGVPEPAFVDKEKVTKLE